MMHKQVQSWGRVRPGVMRSALLLGAVALVGCKKPFPEDTLPDWEERPVTGSFNFDYDQVWEATLEVMGDAATLTDLNKGQGVIRTGWVTDSSDYIFKAYGGTRIPEPIRWRMDLEIKDKNGRTEVFIISKEQIEKDLISADLEFRGAIYQWIDVPSSTSKERAFLESILAQLQSSASQGGSDDYNDDYSDDDYDYDYAQ